MVQLSRHSGDDSGAGERAPGSESADGANSPAEDTSGDETASDPTATDPTATDPTATDQSAAGQTADGDLSDDRPDGDRPQDERPDGERPRGAGQEPGVDRPSLLSPLLSGRSLRPIRRTTVWTRINEHLGIVFGIAAVVLLAILVIGGKIIAERSADSATSKRAHALETMLDGATPRDFLAFNAGVKKPGSLAERIRNEDGFVNVKAVADSSRIRFQPSGWWSGFTERCIVAVVTETEVTVSVPKIACVRVNQSGS